MVKPAHFENPRGGLIQPTATTSSVTRMKRSLSAFGNLRTRGAEKAERFPRLWLGARCVDVVSGEVEGASRRNVTST